MEDDFPVTSDWHDSGWFVSDVFNGQLPNQASISVSTVFGAPSFVLVNQPQ